MAVLDLECVPLSSLFRFHETRILQHLALRLDPPQNFDENLSCSLFPPCLFDPPLQRR